MSLSGYTSSVASRPELLARRHWPFVPRAPKVEQEVEEEHDTDSRISILQDDLRIFAQRKYHTGEECQDGVDTQE